MKHSPQSPPWQKPKGFSLMELIVVTSILTLMSVGVIVGFGGLGDTLKVREAAGAISDLIKQAELEVLTGEYEKNTLYFRDTYLLIVSEAKGATLALNWDGPGGACAPEEEQITAPSNSGSLIQKNQDEETLTIKSLSPPPPEIECVDFESAEDRIWQYQMFDDEQFSDVIRLIHFNLNRKNPSGISLSTGGNDLHMVIEAPYAKRSVYENGSLVSGSAGITLMDANNNVSEPLNIKP